MGLASKFVNVCLRCFELICAAIVVGIVAQYLQYIHDGHGQDNSKVLYTLILGCLSLVLSFVFALPFMYTFWIFPLDFIFFVMWITSFGLLENVSEEFWEARPKY